MSVLVKGLMEQIDLSEYAQSRQKKMFISYKSLITSKYSFYIKLDTETLKSDPLSTKFRYFQFQEEIELT